MFKDLSGIVNGKTAGGVILGFLVFVSIVWTGIEDSIPGAPPGLIVTILASIPTILTFFGLFSAGNDTFNNFKQEVKEFIASSPAIGILIGALSNALDTLPLFNTGGVLGIIGIIVGTILVIFGQKSNIVKARANLEKLPAEFSAKYQKAKEVGG